MHLKQLNLGGRTAVSLFALTLLIALASAELLIIYSLGGTMGIEKVKAKYAGSLLVSSMRGPMYEYVTEDESIAIVERWIDAGAPEADYKPVAEVMNEDCTSCHSKTSTMTKAMPSIPLTTYAETNAFTGRGLPGGKLLMQLHVHIFAIGVILLVVSLLFCAADIYPRLKVLGPVVGFVGLWLDTSGWVLGTVGEWAAWLIVGGGGLLAAAIAGMSVVILVDCWTKVPVIGHVAKD
jgi:hypothetical protein